MSPKTSNLRPIEGQSRQSLDRRLCQPVVQILGAVQCRMYESWLNRPLTLKTLMGSVVRSNYGSLRQALKPA